MIPVSHAALCGLAHAQQQTEFCVRQIFATGGPEPGFTAQSLPEAAVFGRTPCLRWARVLANLASR